MKATQQLTFGKLNVLCERWGINSEAGTGCLLSGRWWYNKKYDCVGKFTSEMQIIRNKLAKVIKEKSLT